MLKRTWFMQHERLSTWIANAPNQPTCLYLWLRYFFANDRLRLSGKAGLPIKVAVLPFLFPLFTGFPIIETSLKHFVWTRRLLLQFRCNFLVLTSFVLNCYYFGGKTMRIKDEADKSSERNFMKRLHYFSFYVVMAILMSLRLHLMYKQQFSSLIT